MFFYDALFRNKTTEPKWLVIVRAIASLVGAGLLCAYAVYVIEKVLEDSNATTTTVQTEAFMQMPNALICPTTYRDGFPYLQFICVHAYCHSTLLTENRFFPPGSYGDALDLTYPGQPCYHIIINGTFDTTIEDAYPPSIFAQYAYENGTGISLADYNSTYNNTNTQWQITFFEPSTDPINTLNSPAPPGFTLPTCVALGSLVCSGCVDETSCNSVLSSISDANNRSQVIDYLLNGGYTFLMNHSQYFDGVIFQGMQIDITLTSSWKNRLGVVSEKNRVSKILMAANQLPWTAYGSDYETTAFSIQDIWPNSRITVTTNEENRTDTVLTALGAIGGIFTLIQGIYKLLFGKTAESPWGLVQTYTYGKLRNSIFNRIKDSYDLDGDYLPLTIPVTENPTPRSLEKVNQRLEAVERMLAEHYVNASVLEIIQKSIKTEEKKTKDS